MSCLLALLEPCGYCAAVNLETEVARGEDAALQY